MRILGELVQGVLVGRLNRFVVEVKFGHDRIHAHLRDPGRLKELLVPGAEILLRKKARPVKLMYEVLAVKHGDLWVFVNSGFHSDLAEEIIERGLISGLRGCSVVKREVRVGDSRIDFLLDCNDVDLYMEVKGCTLVVNNYALFPDAPTLRGRKHILELIDIVKRGGRAAVLFLVMRPDASYLVPNVKTDPKFSEALIIAKNVGVKLYAYTFQFDGKTISPIREIDVVTNNLEEIMKKLPF
ncbi:MAG: DNA/RNA nuclease SfsA [Candidatus Njordarchaeia archaeon]